MGNCALITGVTGQTGSYIADHLLELGYQVVGVTRRRSGGGDWRIVHLLNKPNFILECGDVLDSGSLCRLMAKYKPDEVYNMAAQSYVGLSWHEPYHTGMVTGLGVTNVLEAIRLHSPKTKFLQASSSEMFGNVQEVPQTEKTPHYPRSPYGIAKVYAYWMTVNYRESHGMFCCNAIGFNHESPRRGLEFVTRKVTNGVATIKHNNGGVLKLGNLDVSRDWSHAADFARGYHLALQRDVPDDYIFASGDEWKLQDFLAMAFARVGLNWKSYVEQDPSLIRPAEVHRLLGNPAKARELLGWKPKYSFTDLVNEMVDADMQRVKNGIKD